MFYTILVSTQEYYISLSPDCCKPCLRRGYPATDIQGMPGCRNIRAGGDNVKSSLKQDDVFMCYFVYRSFKEKPSN